MWDGAPGAYHGENKRIQYKSSKNQTKGERESSLVDLILEHLGSDRCEGDDKHDAQGDGVKHCERAECIQEAGDATVSDL